MAHKLGYLRVVPKPQREYVAVASDDDGFPPAIVEGFLGDDRCPGAISSHVHGKPVRPVSSWSLTDGGLWFDRERHDDLAVYRLCRTLGTKPRPPRVTMQDLTRA